MIGYEEPPEINWPQVINEIRERHRNMSPDRIAKVIGASSSALYLIRQGRTKEPTYRIGAKIMAVHAALTKEGSGR